MQDQTYDDYDADAEGASRFGRVRSAVSTAIGAIVAMALLMALGIWFYRLGVRDAQNVPIIRASLEPEKERPKDPGGMVAPHQEIESYDVAGNQPAASAAAVVAAQPPQPKPEDVPMAALQPAQQPEPKPDEVAAVPASNAEPGAPQVSEVTAEPAADGDATEQLALNTASEAEPQAEAPAEDAQAEPAIAEVEAQTEIAGATEFAPARSPVALPRPANLKARIVAAVASEEQNQLDLVKAAASSAVQIQLAADPDEAAIRRKWLSIQKANDDLLHNRALAIQTTISGGTKFYRLRVGPFKSADEARSVCQALKGRGLDCLVARNI